MRVTENRGESDKNVGLLLVLPPFISVSIYNAVESASSWGNYRRLRGWERPGQ